MFRFGFRIEQNVGVLTNRINRQNANYVQSENNRSNPSNIRFYFV